jgi:choline dehydrogenase
VTVALGRPSSRGRLSLQSADPAERPRIEANYLQTREDVAALTEGIRIAQALAEANAFDRWRGAPDDAAGVLRSAADREALARRAADTMFHPAGTCRMGPDPDAVVDAELRVRGVSGLRVADASIMPTVVNAPTNAACVMIAERLAARMREGSD